MKLKKLNSKREVSVSLDKYLIDWNRAVSKPQKAVKDFLFSYWKNQPVLEEFLIPGSLLRIDIVNILSHIAIEVSPKATHRQYNKHFHRGNRMNFVATMKRDYDKQKWCEQNGFTLVEIYDEDIDILSPDWFREKYNVEL